MREGRREQRVIQPDALLELPLQRRRYFLECEMGTQMISPETKKSQPSMPALSPLTSWRHPSQRAGQDPSMCNPLLHVSR